MKAYEATASIAASPDAIWAVLTDAPNYTAWNSGDDSMLGLILISPGDAEHVFEPVERAK